MKANKDQYRFLKDLTPQQFSIIAKGIRSVDKKNSILGNSVKDFDIIKELGKGSYGIVYLVKPKGWDSSKQAGKIISVGSSDNFNKAESKSGEHPTFQFGSTKQSSADLQLLQTQMLSSMSGEPPQQGTYVLKKIPMADKRFKQQIAAVREAEIMAELEDVHGGHPNLIKFYTSFFENDSLYILMEYAARGDLYRILREQRHRKKYISERDMWEYAFQICRAVAFMHARNYMHRDIKCLNIFVTDNKTIKLGDLGASKFQRLGLLIQGSRVGTPLYLAPEVVKAQAYDNKIDIWAIGCALYHLACLEPPFQADNLVTLGNMIAGRRHKQIPHVYSTKFRTFVDSFLSKQAQDRPSAEEALKQIPSFIQNQSARREDTAQATQHAQAKVERMATEPARPVKADSTYLSRQPSRGESIQRLKPSQINFQDGGPLDHANILNCQPSSSNLRPTQPSVERTTTEANRRGLGNYSRIPSAQRIQSRKQRLRRESITARGDIASDASVFQKKKDERQSLQGQASKKRLVSQLNFFKQGAQDEGVRLERIKSEVSSIQQVEEQPEPISVTKMKESTGFRRLTARHGSHAPPKHEKIQTQRVLSQDESRPKVPAPISERKDQTREYAFNKNSSRLFQAKTSSNFLKQKTRPKVSALHSPTSQQSKSQVSFYPIQHKKSEDIIGHADHGNQIRGLTPGVPSGGLPPSELSAASKQRKQLHIGNSQGSKDMVKQSPASQIVPSSRLPRAPPRPNQSQAEKQSKSPGPFKAIHFVDQEAGAEGGNKVSPEFGSRENSYSNIFSSQQKRIPRLEEAASKGDAINLSQEDLEQYNLVSFDFRKDLNESQEQRRLEHSQSQVQSSSNLRVFSRAQKLQAQQQAQTSSRSTFWKQVQDKQIRPQSSVINRIIGAEALSASHRAYSKMASQAQLTKMNNQSAENLRVCSKDSINFSSEGEGGFIISGLAAKEGWKDSSQIPIQKLERNFSQCDQRVVAEKQRLEELTQGKQKSAPQRPMSGQPRKARQIKQMQVAQLGRALASNSSLANQSYLKNPGPSGFLNNTNSATIEERAVPSKGLVDPSNEWANQIINCLTQGDRSTQDNFQGNLQAGNLNQVSSREESLQPGGIFGPNETNQNSRQLLNSGSRSNLPGHHRELPSPDVVYSAGGGLKISRMLSQETSLESTPLGDGGLVRRLREQMKTKAPKSKLEDWVVKVDKSSKVMRLSSAAWPGFSRKVTVNDLKR